MWDDCSRRLGQPGQVNAAAETEESHVAVGDRLCAVNGVGGSAPVMLEALQAAKHGDHFSLTFKREVSVPAGECEGTL